MTLLRGLQQRRDLLALKTGGSVVPNQRVASDVATFVAWIDHRHFLSSLFTEPIEEVRMAGGWTRDGAVQDQIDDTVMDAVLLARARMPSGPGEIHCIECGEPIPERRRDALPGVRHCVACQTLRDSKPQIGGINRRGNKDSQLR